MTLEFMKLIENLADNEENLRYILNDMLLSRMGSLELADKIGIGHDTLKSFMVNKRTTSRLTRMKMAKYCLIERV